MFQLSWLVGKTMSALPEGNVGEIWVTSKSRAAGYWSQPGKTAEDFGGGFSATGNVRTFSRNHLILLL